MLRLVLALAASLSPLALQATVPVPPDPLKRVELSESERLYVALTQRITMCVDPDWEPFERINAAGEHEGIAADLLRLVAQRVGLELQLIPVSSWDESLEASKAGRCQILSFLNRTDSREQWLRFTAPIFLDPNVLITREEHPFIADAHALNS
ncbi:response regulator [Thauera sp. 63]|nr:response regulator [Thauera sp. 63]